MLPNIRTSLENKAVITDLTHKLQLGTENIIARLAFTYSLANHTLTLSQMKDAKGKEYAMKVLFGNQYEPVYIAMVCQKYGINKLNKDLTKYIKLHVDEGLQALNKEYRKNPNAASLDFFMGNIELGLNSAITETI